MFVPIYDIDIALWGIDKKEELAISVRLIIIHDIPMAYYFVIVPSHMLLLLLHLFLLCVLCGWSYDGENCVPLNSLLHNQFPNLNTAITTVLKLLFSDTPMYLEYLVLVLYPIPLANLH